LNIQQNIDSVGGGGAVRGGMFGINSPYIWAVQRTNSSLLHDGISCLLSTGITKWGIIALENLTLDLGLHSQIQGIKQGLPPLHNVKHFLAGRPFISM
jgi:hypothetical protein